MVLVAAALSVVSYQTIGEGQPPEHALAKIIHRVPDVARQHELLGSEILESSFNDTEALVRYRDVAPGAARAHPSEEHFLPLHVAWGAAGEGATAEQVLAGLDAGVLSMDSYLFRR